MSHVKSQGAPALPVPHGPDSEKPTDAGSGRFAEAKHHFPTGSGSGNVSDSGTVTADQPRASDAGPLTGDKRLTVFRAACKERGTRTRAGPRARQERGRRY